MVNILQNHHVLAVPDAAATADYFIEVLGFTPIQVDDPGWRFVARDRLLVRLGSCPDAIAPRQLGDHSYFAYFVVDDVEGYFAHIRDRGGDLLTEPADRPWGMREFALRTPDGHRIMVGQALSE